MIRRLINFHLMTRYIQCYPHPPLKSGYTIAHFQIKESITYFLIHKYLLLVAQKNGRRKYVSYYIYLVIYFRARKLLHQANIFIQMPFANERYINEFKGHQRMLIHLIIS